MDYFIEIQGKRKSVRTIEELEHHLEKSRHRESSDIFLFPKVEDRKGFEGFLYKALGLSTEVIGEGVSILIRGNRSTIIFLDEDHNEYRAINSEYTGPSTAKVEFIIDTGEQSVHPADECFSPDNAIKAVLYFFQYGKRPDWLDYRESKSIRRRKT
jgi:hypothetical protein